MPGSADGRLLINRSGQPEAKDAARSDSEDECDAALPTWHADAVGKGDRQIAAKESVEKHGDRGGEKGDRNGG